MTKEIISSKDLHLYYGKKEALKTAKQLWLSGRQVGRDVIGFAENPLICVL
ncbi:hypothetical protein EfmJHP35_21180 [Enterococcus faecium]|nr:hypothetical protein EfmJHP35_21180 [Enterococcus faecium]